MSNKDGTGPNGKGCKTGRQLGNCEGAESIERGCGKYQRNNCGKRQGRRCNQN